MKSSGLRVVVSNTGPIISALQSGCMHILLQLYDQIYIPANELQEYEKHGAGQEIQELIDAGVVIVLRNPTESKSDSAKAIAEEIAAHHATKDRNPDHHLPEAEAIALMQRNGPGGVELLIDELAARGAARSRGVPVIGFPGILIRACQQGMIDAEDVKNALEECRRQGTHYSPRLINEVFNKLKGP
jgi:predicted nucleic acid-binding protein